MLGMVKHDPYEGQKSAERLGAPLQSLVSGGDKGVSGDVTPSYLESLAGLMKTPDVAQPTFDWNAIVRQQMKPSWYAS